MRNIKPQVRIAVVLLVTSLSTPSCSKQTPSTAESVVGKQDDAAASIASPPDDRTTPIETRLDAASRAEPVVFVAGTTTIEAKTIKGKALATLVKGLFEATTSGVYAAPDGILWYASSATLTALDLRRPNPVPITILKKLLPQVLIDVYRADTSGFRYESQFATAGVGNRYDARGLLVAWGTEPRVEPFGGQLGLGDVAGVEIVGRGWQSDQTNRPVVKLEPQWTEKGAEINLRAVERAEDELDTGPGLSQLVCDDQRLSDSDCRECCDADLATCCEEGDFDPGGNPDCTMPVCITPHNFGTSGWLLFMARRDDTQTGRRREKNYGCLLYDPTTRSVAVPSSNPQWKPATDFDESDVPKEPWGEFGSCGPYHFDSTGTVYYTAHSHKVCPIGSACIDMGGAILGFLRPGHTIFYGLSWL